MVPHLVTANPGPILELEKKLLDSNAAIERWFRLQWQAHQPPFYASVDLRNAGFKLAPVDTNLYPGGFNNLSEAMLPLAVHAAQSAIDVICPDARSLLLIPEKHTRNQFYLRNVARLQAILRQTGLDVRLGTMAEDVTEPFRVELPEGIALDIAPVQRHGNRVGLDGFDPCAVLLNNDLSAGTPGILAGIDQLVLPALHAGWTQRRKSKHFAAYDVVVESFSQLLGIDPWLINPYFGRCGEVNFQDKTTANECLESNVEALLFRIRAKYREYGISEKPFVIVKADAGTYGMGIMTVKDPSEVRELNRKQRNKMAVVKDGLQVTEVIIQEGVHTIERVNEGVAEPVVYMIDRYVVGGFYRVHAERGTDENLNAPGMEFVPLPFASDCCMPICTARPGDEAPNRFYMYGVVARLAALAAAVELQMTDPANTAGIVPTLVTEAA
ncbi:glutamate--cysteine ligase [Derxia gummosa]|uniref:Glutamate--cysteine ligase n=1 Tax=Derxia gummosa DSM 723 TaxID=1121388 RepID=A0A8B6X8T4_9BURK|nr:glutamate--cysteine ligase [Derxia gummosa]